MKEMKIFNVSVTNVEESMLASGYPMMSSDTPPIMCDFPNTVTMLYDNYAKRIVGINPGNPGVVSPEINDDDAKYISNSIFVIKQLSTKKPVTTILANAEIKSGHDCFLKGINVSFDISYPIHWSMDFQTYPFADIVSSSSSIHCITKFDIGKSVSKQVSLTSIKVVKKMIAAYNKAAELKKLNNNQDGDIRCVRYADGSWDAIKLSDQLHQAPTFVLNMRDMYSSIIANAPQGLMKIMRITTNALQLKTIIADKSDDDSPYWRKFVDWAKSLYFWRYFNMYPSEALQKSTTIQQAFDTLDYLISLYLDGYVYVREVTDAEYPHSVKFEPVKMTPKDMAEYEIQLCHENTRALKPAYLSISYLIQKIAIYGNANIKDGIKQDCDDTSMFYFAIREKLNTIRLLNMFDISEARQELLSKYYARSIEARKKFVFIIPSDEREITQSVMNDYGLNEYDIVVKFGDINEDNVESKVIKGDKDEVLSVVRKLSTLSQYQSSLIINDIEYHVSNKILWYKRDGLKNETNGVDK